MLAIRRVILEAFRNYAHIDFSVSPAPVVLVGENGAGKTNCLEAISLLSPGRGLRRANLTELQNTRDTRPWAISFAAHGLKGDVQLGMGRDPESGPDKRIIRMDGKTVKSQTSLRDHLAVLWLTPDMDRLMAESTSERRKFMDRLVYAIAPDHLMHINRYEEAMRERNRLLRDGPADPAWLSALENTMAQDGAAIAAARLHWSHDITPFLHQGDQPFPHLALLLDGILENKLLNTPAAVDAEDYFRQILSDNRRNDEAAGVTLLGPHRTQLHVNYAEKNVPAELCSTGEQKAMLVSLILAQTRLLKHVSGHGPLLLLDDIMAHLDENRRAALSGLIIELGVQAWASGTDADFFKALQGHAQFLQVTQAHISPLDL